MNFVGSTLGRVNRQTKTIPANTIPLRANTTFVFIVTFKEDTTEPVWLYLVGSIEKLGSWDPAKGLKAKETPAGSGRYVVVLRLPKQEQEFEWKWTAQNKARDNLLWEANDNRVTKADSSVIKHITIGTFDKKASYKVTSTAASPPKHPFYIVETEKAFVYKRLVYDEKGECQFIFLVVCVIYAICVL